MIGRSPKERGTVERLASGRYRARVPLYGLGRVTLGTFDTAELARLEIGAALAEHRLVMRGYILPPLDHPEIGGVYAIQGVPGWIKIGRAANIRKRLVDFTGAHPVPIRLLAVLDTDPERERQYHERFAHLRGHGEWFRVDDELERVVVEARQRGWRRVA